MTNLALEIMRKNPKVLNARNEWGNMALMIKPIPSIAERKCQCQLHG